MLRLLSHASAIYGVRRDHPFVASISSFVSAKKIQVAHSRTSDICIDRTLTNKANFADNAWLEENLRCDMLYSHSRQQRILRLLFQQKKLAWRICSSRGQNSSVIANNSYLLRHAVLTAHKSARKCPPESRTPYVIQMCSRNWSFQSQLVATRWQSEAGESSWLH